MAARLVAHFKSLGHEEATAAWFRYQGCRGTRAPQIHWSHDCALLQCYVDERGLEYCYECEDFICHKLEKWAADYPHHRRALDWLKEMHSKRET